MKQIMIRKIPDDIGMAFKLKCEKENISINKAIVRLITKEVEKDRKENL